MSKIETIKLLKSIDETRQLAETGDSEAMLQLGFRMENGIDCESNIAAALSWYKKYQKTTWSDQVVANHIQELEHLSDPLRQYELFLDGDPLVATKRLLEIRVRAGLGDKADLLRLAKAYLDKQIGFTSHDGIPIGNAQAEKTRIEQASACLEAIAEFNDPSDETKLGPLFFQIGRYYEMHHDQFASGWECGPFDVLIEGGNIKAVEYFKKSAEAGFVPAQRRLAEILSMASSPKTTQIYADAIEKNDTEAAKWWRSAAEQSDPEAQYQLGLAICNGIGTTKNAKEGTEWIRKAAQSGHEKAKHWLSATNRKSRGHRTAHSCTPLLQAVADLKTPPNDREAGRQMTVLLKDGIQMDFIWVPGGVLSRHGLRGVSLSGFWVGQTPVTVAQWNGIVPDPFRKTETSDNPVTGVSWVLIRNAFIDELAIHRNVQEVVSTWGRGDFEETHDQRFCHVRFPTSCEWEWAARGSILSKGFRFSGSNNPQEVGWVAENSGGKVHPVGKKKPNELGIYDMTGNVLEWCLDGVLPDQDAADWLSERVNPCIDPTNADESVLRGGSWFHDGDSFGVEDAYRGQQTVESDIIGFRVVLSPVVDRSMKYIYR